jgi:LmbE family N-acetylglucosaminyl deacetylase
MPLITSIRFRVTLLLPALLLIMQAEAQTATTTPGEILLGLQKLNTVGSVLYIAAHPDDENTRLLAWLANERKLRTGYLSLTRGDGGQNLIGKEQGEMLGLLRTQELLAARRTDGAEQFFTRANDFGFSKNPDETFTIWNRDSVLADVVWTIRKFRPDVIICRFPTTGEGGHGHHTASAILAQEAFDAAADPRRFPHQLAWVSTWQPRRLFWNTFNFGTTNTTAPNQLKIDVGGFNPLLGKSYGEIAAESRSFHKSQGFGTARSRGEAIEYFKQLKGDSVKGDLFEGINQAWSRIPAVAKLGPLTAAVAKSFNPQSPEASVPQLIAIHKALSTLSSSDATVEYWKAQKLKETEALIVAASGLWLEAAATDYTAIPGKPVTFNTQILSRRMSNVTLNGISWLSGSDTTTAIKLGKNVLYTFAHTETLNPGIQYSNPYWLAEEHTPGMYIVKAPLMIGKPENDYGPRVTYDLTINGQRLKINRPVVYKSVDPVKGEIYRPLEVLPPVTIGLSDKVMIFRDTAMKQLFVTVKANTAGVSGSLVIPNAEGWKLRIINPSFTLANKGDEARIQVMITKMPGGAGQKLPVMVSVNGASYGKSIRRLEYDHVPYQFMLSDAQVSLVTIDLKKRGKNIGYIAGAGDDVPASLSQVGYNVTMLTDDILASGNLSQYDAIVTGVRAYNVNDKLPRYHDRLMDYVKGGGNLIVQYNTNTRLGPMTAKPGPYPFTIANQRVTDEHAAVTFVNPNHPALNYPNKITQQDFEGWIQERGIYFATDIDKRYETVLSMNDKGENPNEGSVIIGKYGEGNFVYTGLVFFRQLPAGNTGAYRLFVNLLSLPHNKVSNEKD